MRAAAASGEAVYIISANEQFVFKRVQPKTWQGALKGKIRIKGDLLTTDQTWEATI